MKTVLLGATKGEERENLRQYIQSNEKVLDIIRQICYNRYIGLEGVPISDYDSASWSHKQAHVNGQRAELKTLIDLLTLSPDPDKN